MKYIQKFINYFKEYFNLNNYLLINYNKNKKLKKNILLNFIIYLILILLFLSLILIIKKFLCFYFININSSLSKSKNNKFLFKRLLWKNQKIDLKKIRKEIFEYKYINFTYINKEEIYKSQNPKISLIITLFNQESYIIRIYYCIQKQSLKDIEIIFVDDYSKDNSYYIIKKLMEKDKRIVYLKNSINKGQFYSRNKGIFKSKGEYVLIIDPDDLLLNDILTKIYETAKHFNLDIVQYYHMIGNLDRNHFQDLSIKGIFYQPQVKNVFFNSSERFLWDKLIKRNIFIKSIKFMKKKFRKERFAIHNDETACYGVFRVAYSYGLLEQVGYFWNRNNPNSTSRQNLKPENTNGRFKSIFTTMDYYFEQSDNNIFEKNKGGYNFFKLRIIRRYERQIKYLTKGFDYINKVIDMYLNSYYFTEEQKNILQKFKDKINLQKIKINNNK